MAGGKDLRIHGQMGRTPEYRADGKDPKTHEQVGILSIRLSEKISS